MMKTRFIRSLMAAGMLAALAACGTSSLTPDQEYYAGRAFSANVLAKYSKLYEERGLNEYLYKVGTLLAIASERAETFKGPYQSYHFTVLDTDAINAFGAPSGFIFITKGLIKRCESEDELAAVLAHEVTHVVLKHPEEAALTAKQNSETQKIIAGLGSLASAVGKATGKDKIADMGQKTQQFANAMDEIFDIVEKGFSREQEYAADQGALVLLARVGYDPLALKRMLQRLGSRRQGTIGWAGDTHPPPQDRVAEIDKYLAQRQKQGMPLRGQVSDVRTERFKAATAALR